MRPEPWVVAYLRAWGAATWRRWTAKDGWPARTVLCRVIEEGFTGAAQGYSRQAYPEGYIGTALEVARALTELPETDRTILTVHYVIPIASQHKARRLHLSRSAYYGRLNVAENKIAGRIDRPDTF